MKKTKTYYTYWKADNREIGYSIAHGKKELKIVKDTFLKKYSIFDLVVRDNEGNLLETIKARKKE